MNQTQLAAWLGDVSAATLSRWENKDQAVPDWVAHKMLRTVEIPLPIEDLHTLLDHARNTGDDLQSILVDAIRLYLRSQRKPAVSQPEAAGEGLNAAEDSPEYG